jgi:hypothetical protein
MQCCRNGLMIVAALLLTSFVGLDAYAVLCNNQVPEYPAPLCEVVASTCEQIAAGGCPVAASCMSTQGVYRENVPVDCVTWPGPNTTCCLWSTDQTKCSESFSCKRVAGVPMCVKVASCAVATNSYRWNEIECEIPGSSGIAGAQGLVTRELITKSEDEVIFCRRPGVAGQSWRGWPLLSGGSYERYRFSKEKGMPCLAGSQQWSW